MLWRTTVDFNLQVHTQKNSHTSISLSIHFTPICPKNLQGTALSKIVVLEFTMHRRINIS